MAQNNLALCYEYGLGIKANFRQAALLYEKAIQNGSIDAQENIKRLLENRQNEIKSTEIKRKNILDKIKINT